MTGGIRPNVEKEEAMAKSPRRRAGDKESSGESSVADFIEELQRHPSGDHVIQGMVKPAEDASGLMFAHAGECGEWIQIPASSMKSIREVGRVRCRGHSHMVAEIELKEPEDEIGRVFASIANLRRSSISQLQAKLAGGVCSSNADCPPGQHCGPDGFGGSKCLPGPF